MFLFFNRLKPFSGPTNYWLSVNAYDETPSKSEFPWNQVEFNHPPLQNINGKLVATAYRVNGLNTLNSKWKFTFINYDKLGRIENKYIYTSGLLGKQAFHYNYDRQGNILELSFSFRSQNFYHFYDYDTLSRLTKVYVNTDSLKPSDPIVEYHYNFLGQLKRVEYAHRKFSIPYEYDIRDRMFKIGDVEGEETSPFAAHLKFQGASNIKEAIFRQNQLVDPETGDHHYRYHFTYDERNQMLSARYFLGLNSQNHNQRYDVEVIYDIMGNIKNLNRYDDKGVRIDELIYQYQGQHLMNVHDAFGYSKDVKWDADPFRFTYDLKGNVVSKETINGKGVVVDDLKFEYDLRNLPLRMLQKNGTESRYHYDQNGQRIYKHVTKIVDGKQKVEEEHYLLDGATITAVLDREGSIQHWNIFSGGTVIGRMDADGQIYHYLKDHLGSTRAVTDQNGVVIESNDYYPFGLKMPNRVLVDSSSKPTKEGFTGKERDEESGLDYFGARYYVSTKGHYLDNLE